MGQVKQLLIQEVMAQASRASTTHTQSTASFVDPGKKLATAMGCLPSGGSGECGTAIGGSQEGGTYME